MPRRHHRDVSSTRSDRPSPARSRRWIGLAVAVLVLCALAPIGLAQGSYADRFDTAWRLVDERYWRIERLDVDWNQLREEYRPDALAADNDEAFYQILTDMYDRLGDDHSTFVSPTRVIEIREAYGDLPCLGVFGRAGADSAPEHPAYLQMVERETTDLETMDLETAGSANVEFRVLADRIGYIRLADLATPGTAQSVRLAVRSLAGRKVESLIVDLRGNPGGRLVEMMQVAGIFTDGFLWRTLTNWTLPLPYPALGTTETTLPLIFLIDGQVHSAAEGLAGALQQQGRAKVIGERSAGNVEAVLPFCLRDGSQAWIATGVLAPIGGATWEGQGVEPDISVPAADALERAVAYLEQR